MPGDDGEEGIFEELSKRQRLAATPDGRR